MNQHVIKYFTSGGAALNIDLGFVPDYVRVINTGAADTEVYMLEWFEALGDAKELWHYMIDNDGGGDVNTPVKKASGGYVSAYDTSHVGERLSVTFDYTGGASEDLVTAVPAAGHNFVDGERIVFDASGGLAAGLAINTIYYVRDATATTFRLALTSGGSVVEMTSDGTAPNYARSIDNVGPRGGGKGITIAAAFQDDGDVIYVDAYKADRVIAAGDLG